VDLNINVSGVTETVGTVGGLLKDTLGKVKGATSKRKKPESK
jgi:hypothetical protein